MNVQEKLAENKRRMEAEKADSSFDPCTGIGCSGRRRKVPTPVAGLPEALIPEEMLDDPDYEAAQADATAWQRLRCRHDFEYWCAVCATVKHKLEGRDVPFMLNRPQRRVAAIMESDRRAGRPIRLIMLKARQWGGRAFIYLLIYLKIFCNFALWKRKL